MKTLEHSPAYVKSLPEARAYEGATANVDAYLATGASADDPMALALIAEEEVAYEAFFHAANERKRRLHAAVSGEFTTEAKARRSCDGGCRPGPRLLANRFKFGGGS